MPRAFKPLFNVGGSAAQAVPVYFPAEAQLASFSYIEGWYYPARLHAGPGYRSPVAFEVSMQTAEADT